MRLSWGSLAKADVELRSMCLKLPLLAMRPWALHGTFLSLSFLIFEVGTMASCHDDSVRWARASSCHRGGGWPHPTLGETWVDLRVKARALGPEISGFYSWLCHTHLV